MRKFNSFNINVIILVLFNFVFMCNGVGQKLAPEILSNWKDVEYYKEGTTHSFNCTAEGSDLTYNLYMNEIYHSTNKDGNFMLQDDDKGLAGFYQCKVTNIHGTSMTDKTDLKRAVGVLFPKIKPPNNKVIVNGQDHATISCIFEKNPEPDPVVNWYQKDDYGSYELVQNNDEVQFDGKQTLFFTTPSRYMSYSFRCEATNWFLQETVNSSYFSLMISTYDIDKMPIKFLTWSSSSLIPYDFSDKVIGFVGGNITIRCLFAGYPKPQLEWLKDDKEIDTSQWDFKSNKTEITSKRPLDITYRGLYACKATEEVAKHIQLFIRALPSFPHESDQPMDTILVEGGNTTFKCSPTADPAADIKWYRNGELLDLSKFPNYKLDNTGKELTISNVSTENDSCVIRCEAWNTFGHISSEGYLAVIEEDNGNKPSTKTAITEDGYSTSDKEFKVTGKEHDDEGLSGSSTETMVQGNSPLTDKRVTESSKDWNHSDDDVTGSKSDISTDSSVTNSSFSTHYKDFKLTEADEHWSHSEKDDDNDDRPDTTLMATTVEYPTDSKEFKVTKFNDHWTSEKTMLPETVTVKNIPSCATRETNLIFAYIILSLFYIDWYY